MAQAAKTNTTSGVSNLRLPLSSLIEDLFVRTAFERAERDRGDSAVTAIAEPCPRTDSDSAQAAALVAA